MVTYRQFDKRDKKTARWVARYGGLSGDPVIDAIGYKLLRNQTRGYVVGAVVFLLAGLCGLLVLHRRAELFGFIVMACVQLGLAIYHARRALGLKRALRPAAD